MPQYRVRKYIVDLSLHDKTETWFNSRYPIMVKEKGGEGREKGRGERV